MAHLSGRIRPDLRFKIRISYDGTRPTCPICEWCDEANLTDIEVQFSDFLGISHESEQRKQKFDESSHAKNRLKWAVLGPHDKAEPKPQEVEDMAEDLVCQKHVNLRQAFSEIVRCGFGSWHRIDIERELHGTDENKIVMVEKYSDQKDFSPFHDYILPTISGESAMRAPTASCPLFLRLAYEEALRKRYNFKEVAVAAWTGSLSNDAWKSGGEYPLASFFKVALAENRYNRYAVPCGRREVPVYIHPSALFEFRKLGHTMHSWPHWMLEKGKRYLIEKGGAMDYIALKVIAMVPDCLWMVDLGHLEKMSQFQLEVMVLRYEIEGDPSNLMPDAKRLLEEGYEPRRPFEVIHDNRVVDSNEISISPYYPHCAYPEIHVRQDEELNIIKTEIDAADILKLDDQAQSDDQTRVATFPLVSPPSDRIWDQGAYRISDQDIVSSSEGVIVTTRFVPIETNSRLEPQLRGSAHVHTEVTGLRAPDM